MLILYDCYAGGENKLQKNSQKLCWNDFFQNAQKLPEFLLQNRRPKGFEKKRRISVSDDESHELFSRVIFIRMWLASKESRKTEGIDEPSVEMVR